MPGVISFQVDKLNSGRKVALGKETLKAEERRDIWEQKSVGFVDQARGFDVFDCI